MANQRVGLSEPRVPEADIDGRVLRGERTRVDIVSAILGLLRDGLHRPTAEQVAARAGVGVRSVFRHFDDMESLYAAMNALLAEEIRPFLGPEAGTFSGDTRERLRELLRRRGKIFECVAPARRRSFEGEAGSSEVRRALAQFNRLLAAQTNEALGSELEGCDPDLLEALEAVLSFEYWDRLYRVQHVSRNRVLAILERTVASFLSGLPEVRSGSRSRTPIAEKRSGEEV